MVGTRGDAAWSTYVAVEDADVAVQRLVAAGATVRSAPADAREGGRTAALTDPEGAEFRIWQARRRLGAQVANQPGAWNFSDLHTRDPGAARKFYADAFDWQIDDLGFAMMIRRPGYGDHLEATVDPGIRARQSKLAAPLASRMRSPGSRPPPPRNCRAGTSRSLLPTGTRRSWTLSGSAPKSLTKTTPLGRARH